MVIISPDVGKLLSISHSTRAAVFTRLLRLLLDDENAVLSAEASAENTNEVPATLNFSEVKRILALNIVAPWGIFNSVKRSPDVTVLVPLLKIKSLLSVVTLPSISWAS